jgi:hypothetical protein
MTLPNPVPNVRFCNEDDRDLLLAFVRAGHEESAMFTLSDEKVKKVIDHGINPPKDDSGNINHLVMIGIIEDPKDKNKIAASLAVEYTQPWYSEDWVLYELWNNVHKDYRRSTYAQDLIKFGKWISDSTKRPLGMQIYTTERLTPKIELYRRKMPQVGALFVYNMQMATGPAIARQRDSASFNIIEIGKI